LLWYLHWPFFSFNPLPRPIHIRLETIHIPFAHYAPASEAHTNNQEKQDQRQYRRYQPNY
jgi:hypothetical protein